MLKVSYLIDLVESKDGGFVVYIPDFNINTQGQTITEALEMAKDAIESMGVFLQDEKETVPEPSAGHHEAYQQMDGHRLSYVTVDFDEYRRKMNNRTVRRNVTLPYWLDEKAKESNINVSGILQDALKEHLHIQ